jgi:predicted dienelactone hydrolase
MISNPRPQRRLRAFAVLLAGATIAAACSSSDDAGSDATDAPVASDAAPAGTAPVDTSATSEVPADTAVPAQSVVPDTEAPATTAAELAELQTIGQGPYDVGVQTITITDVVRNRPLTVDVWFPIDDTGDLPLHQYTLIPGTYYESPTAVSATVADIATDGPFPLVVYSHGSGGLRFLASDYTETIASYGYIVAAPDHTGNTALERLSNTETEFDVTALNRPQDVTTVINEMLNPESTETVGFVANVDPESVAVTGHSFGGFTAYAMASGYENAVGSVEADTRVDAIIPLAPATGEGDGRLLSDEMLAAITVPSLVLVGTNDQTTPADPNVDRPWELSNSTPSYRGDLLDAQHQTFSNMCQYQETVPLLPDVPPLIIETIASFAEQGCMPGDMPIDRAQALTNTFAVAFLESIFRGGQMIDPATTAIPDDVTFQAK